MMDANRAKLANPYAQYEERVRRAVLRIHPKRRERCSVEELVQAGMAGLHRAAQLFDPEKNDDLWAYAEFSVKGHILDRLAEERSPQERVALTLFQKSERQGQQRRATYAENVAAATTLLTIHHSGLAEAISPEAALERKEEADAFWSTVATLPDRERLVIEQLCDDRCPTATEVASELGVEDWMVSRIRKRAVALLREALVEPPAATAIAAPTPRKPTLNLPRPRHPTGGPTTPFKRS